METINQQNWHEGGGEDPGVALEGNKQADGGASAPVGQANAEAADLAPDAGEDDVEASGRQKADHGKPEIGNETADGAHVPGKSVEAGKAPVGDQQDSQARKVTKAEADGLSNGGLQPKRHPSKDQKDWQSLRSFNDSADLQSSPGRYYGSMSKRMLHGQSPAQEKLKGLATNTSTLHKKNKNVQDKAAENYFLQASRIQVTDEWKDACINQELEQIAKLEQFI